jgi:hypothetical protein
VVAILARVTHDPEEARGPDVLSSVEVPARWLAEGATVEIRLPRLLPCARCEGGGCDVCQRKGAFERDPLAAPGELLVSLPRQAEGASNRVCLRLPGYGARGGGDAELPLGHLLLTIVPRGEEAGWLPASNLRKLEEPAASGPKRRRTIAQIWALAVCLTSLLLWWFFF